MSEAKPPARTPPAPKRRADAERSIAAILDAAVDALASDPDASMAEIARRAGVVRATTYVHFPTRDALLDAVMDYTIADVAATVKAAEPDVGEPAEALVRLLRATWRKLDRLHSIIAINEARLSAEDFHQRHRPVVSAIAPLIVRGQKAGAFRADLPTAWHLSMLLAIVHAASREVQNGRIGDSQVEDAMLSTVLRALGTADSPRA